MSILEERIVTQNKRDEDREIENNLRPNSFDQYIGQERIKRNLRIFIQAALARSESLDHVLLHGPPGLGKTTLANIISREMGVSIKTTSGPAIERAGDLAAIVTNLEPEDVLFIDEIHRLNRAVEEVLYPAMEDFSLDIVIGKGPSARSVRLDLPRFTLIGATTRAGLLTSPLRDRFGVINRLEYYTKEQLQKIIKRSARILDIPIDSAGGYEIARRSRGVPRVANRLLRRVRDFAEVKADGRIDEKIAKEALNMLEVDRLGLDPLDRRLLLTIIDKFNGGPVGVKTLSAAVNEEVESIEQIYEPYLLQEGYLKRTSQGRKATRRAYEHLNREFSGEESETETLF